MNLKNLFKPKLLEARITEPSKRKEGLVYAINDYKTSSIFLYVDGQNDLLLGERWHPVTSLCVHNNWLYDGGYKQDSEEVFGFVIDTITGKDIMDRKDNPVHSLCSHNGVLYKGGDDGIYEVLTGKKIADRGGQVTALCSHEGTLYDCGTINKLSGLVNDTFKSKTIHKKYYTVALYSHEGVLYSAAHDPDSRLFLSWCIFDIFNNKKIINRAHITKISSYRGSLCESSFERIDSTFTNKNLLERKRKIITAMCSIPSELEEQIKHTKNYGRSFNEIQRINPKGFVEYMTNVSDSQERRRIIEQLFNCDSINEEVLKWLNENEQDVMRKAAFY